MRTLTVLVLAVFGCGGEQAPDSSPAASSGGAGLAAGAGGDSGAIRGGTGGGTAGGGASGSAAGSGMSGAGAGSETPNGEWDFVRIGGNFHAVWGSSASDITVAGAFGTIAHSTGADDWTETELEVDAALLSLWQAGPNELYTVNKSGELYYSSGGAWEWQETSEYLGVVWGLDREHVYLLGAPGGSEALILLGNAALGFTRLATDEIGSKLVEAIWASATDDLYVSAASSLWHRSGSEPWRNESRGRAWAISGSSATNVMAATYDDGVLATKGDGVWVAADVPFRKGERPSGVFVYDDQTAFVVGNKSGIYALDGERGWALIGVGSGETPTGVWAPNRDEVYAVGSLGISHGRRKR